LAARSESKDAVWQVWVEKQAAPQMGACEALTPAAQTPPGVQVSTSACLD